MNTEKSLPQSGSQDGETAPETFALLCKLRDGDEPMICDMEELYDHAVKLEQERDELLTALKALMGAAVDESDAGEEEMNALDAAWKQARAAVKKAEGN